MTVAFLLWLKHLTDDLVDTIYCAVRQDRSPRRGGSEDVGQQAAPQPLPPKRRHLRRSFVPHFPLLRRRGHVRLDHAPRRQHPDHGQVGAVSLERAQAWAARQARGRGERDRWLLHRQRYLLHLQLSMFIWTFFSSFVFDGRSASSGSIQSVRWYFQARD